MAHAAGAITTIAATAKPAARTSPCVKCADPRSGSRPISLARHSVMPKFAYVWKSTAQVRINVYCPKISRPR